MANVCSRCGRLCGVDRCCRLWDANDYCRECIEKCFPVLSQYMQNNTRLEEIMPSVINLRLPNRWHSIRGVWSPSIIIVAMLLCSAFMIADDAWAWIIFAGLIVQLLFKAAMLLLAYSLGRLFCRRHGPTGIRIDNGRVEFLERGATVRCFALKHATWYQVWDVEESAVADGVFGSLNCVVVRNSAVAWPDPRAVELCGFDTEMIEVWKEFFDIACVPRLLNASGTKMAK